MIKFVQPIEEHLVELHRNSRPEEQAEVWASNLSTVYEAAKSSLEKSIEAYTALEDDKVMGMLGLCPYGPKMGDTASPWLLTTVLAPKKPRYLLNKKFINKWNKEWPVLENFIDARYLASIRWARHLGFTIYDPEPYGPFQYMFHRIQIRRN